MWCTRSPPAQLISLFFLFLFFPKCLWKRMLSSAISYALSKEKKGRGWGEFISVCACVGGEWEWGRAAEASQCTAVGQADVAWEQRDKGAIRWGENRFRCTVQHRQHVDCDSRSDEGRFPCAHCSTARWLCCSVESNSQAGRGMGRKEEEEERGGWLQWYQSLPASLDIREEMGSHPQCAQRLMPFLHELLKVPQRRMGG